VHSVLCPYANIIVPFYIKQSGDRKGDPILFVLQRNIILRQIEEEDKTNYFTNFSQTTPPETTTKESLVK